MNARRESEDMSQLKQKGRSALKAQREKRGLEGKKKESDDQILSSPFFCTKTKRGKSAQKQGERERAELEHTSRCDLNNVKINKTTTTSTTQLTQKTMKGD